MTNGGAELNLLLNYGGGPYDRVQHEPSTQYSYMYGFKQLSGHTLL